MADMTKPRPVYRNIFITQIAGYHLPIAGMVSILHRVSGAILFLLLPFIVWLFDASVTSEISFEAFTTAFVVGIGFLPGWFVKLVVLGLIWAYLHHLIAGVRHVWMDITHRVSLAQGRISALVTLGSTVLLTLAAGAKLFGLY